MLPFLLFLLLLRFLPAVEERDLAEAAEAGSSVVSSWMMVRRLRELRLSPEEC